MSVTPGTSSSWFFFWLVSITSNDSTLFSFISSPHSAPIVHTTDNSTLKVHNIGHISTPSVSVPDTLYVPKLFFNLISVGQLCELGTNISFSSCGCVVQDSQTGKIIGTGRKIGRLFELTSLHIPIKNFVAAISSSL